MVSLSIESAYSSETYPDRGATPHRRYNLFHLAALLNGGRGVFAPGFNGPEKSAQHLRQIVGTLLQLPKLLVAPGAAEISGPLSSYGKLDVTIKPARYGSIVRQVMSGHPSIVVRGSAKRPPPLQNLCAYLGVDMVSSLQGKILDNPILVFECLAQGQPVFVHLGVGAAGLKAVERHRNGLRRLADAALAPEMRAATARIIEMPQSRACVLVQTKVPGQDLRLRDMTQAQVQQHIERTLDLSLAFSGTGRKLPNGPDDAYIREKLSTLGTRVPQNFVREVMPAVEAVSHWPNRENMPATLVHGDLWLANVLFESGRPVGLVDWEWSRRDGLPAFDALQLICGTLAAHRNLPIAALLAQVWDSSAREPWVAAMLAKIRERLQIDQDALVRTALVLWLGIIRRSAVETTGTSPDWYDKNVLAPAQSLKATGILAGGCAV